MSRNVLAACMFASLLLFSACSNSVTGPSATSPSRPDSFRDFSAVVRSDLDTYWGGRFQAMSLPYRPTSGMRFWTSTVFTGGCGSASAGDGPFYCSRDLTVYLEQSFMEERVTRIGDFAGAVIIAHEIGHHVQNLRGLLGPGRLTIEKELQADCLAGAWIASEGARGLLAAGDLQEAAKLVYEIGDPAGSPWYHEQAHGSPTLRIRAFTTGVQEPTACLQE